MNNQPRYYSHLSQPLLTLRTQFGRVVCYTLMALFVLLPLSWGIFGAFKPQGEIFIFPPTIIPNTFTLEAFRVVFSETQIPRYLVNSLIVSMASTALVLILASNAAYVFSRWEFRGKNQILLLLLACQLIPTIVLIVPYYLMLATYKLINTYTGLILVLSATHTSFAIWILKAHFDAVPRSLDEAAMIDGATRLRILWTVILPVSLPGLASAGAITFITVWAEFLIPAVVANSPESMMISAGVFLMFGHDSTTFYNRLFAGAVTATLPVVIVYMIAQKQFISGLGGGAEKG